jgi:hypothetical protein
LRHPDLTPLMQAVLLGSILVLTTVAFVRFGLFFRNRYACLPYRYPAAWTAEQIITFERLRLALGGCLATIWFTFLLTAPQLPVSWPFGFEEALLTIGLLLLTNGWLVLLVRLNWENSLLSKYRFRTGFAVVALWWMAVFAVILAAIGWATTVHFHFWFPNDTIA